MISSKTSSGSLWQPRTAAAALLLCLTSVACGTTKSEQEVSGTSATTDAVKQGTASGRTRLTVASLGAPQVARALIRPGSTTYEIEVQSPKGFSPRAFNPILRIGDKEFTDYRESSLVGEYGAVFRVERATFAALADDSVVSVGYDRSFAHSLSFGRLNKGSLAIR